MKTNYDIKLGVSLYSYQDNYDFHRYDIEGCIAAAAGAGVFLCTVFLRVSGFGRRVDDLTVPADFAFRRFIGFAQVPLDHKSRLMLREHHITDISQRRAYDQHRRHRA